MRIYIAGRITGDRHYKRKFRKAEKALAKKGHSCMSPAWLENYPEFSWEQYMQATGAMQEVCNAVFFLPDWEKSKSAIAEYHRADDLGQRKFFDIKKVPENYGQVS